MCVHGNMLDHEKSMKLNHKVLVGKFFYYFCSYFSHLFPTIYLFEKMSLIKIHKNKLSVTPNNNTTYATTKIIYTGENTFLHETYHPKYNQLFPLAGILFYHIDCKDKFALFVQI